MLNKRYYKSRGVVLLLVLWLLIVMTVVVLSLTQMTKVDNAVHLVEADKVQARWLARAGVNRALAELSRDKTDTDNMGDSWYDNAGAFGDVDLLGGSYRVYADRLENNQQWSYGLIDEASKVNVQVADRETLLQVPGMSEALVEAIVRQRTDGRRAGEAAADSVGSETVFFETLRLAGALGDAKVFYGEDRNYNGILENNENDRAESAPADNADGLLDRGVMAYLTPYSFDREVDGQGQDRLNINSADEDGLREKLNISAGEALWIFEHQGGFVSIGDILDENVDLSMASSISVELASTGTAAKTQPAGATPAVRTTATNENNSEGAKAQEEEIEPVRPGLRTFISIADRIKVTDDDVVRGRININTASREVLRCLPEVDEKMAEQIYLYRRGRGGFDTVAGLLSVPGIKVGQFREMVNYVTVRSNVFTIRSRGKAERTGLTHTVEAVVRRTDRKLEIIYWRED